MEAMPSISLPQVVVAVLVVFFGSILADLILQLCLSKIPKTLPRIGNEGSTWISLRTRLEYITDSAKLQQKAWLKYARVGKYCVIPFGLTGEHVMVPWQSWNWMITQPDTALSFIDAAVDIDSADHILQNVQTLRENWLHQIIHQKINRSLVETMALYQEELAIALDERLGMDTDQWKEINVFDTIRLAIAQASSRYTVSEPLCRDEDYLKDQMNWGELYIRTIAIFTALPGFLRPLLSKLVNFPMRRIERRTLKRIRPFLNERLSYIGGDKGPQDILQAMLEIAHTPGHRYDPSDITVRLHIANLGALHMTIMTATNIVTDVVSSDLHHNTISIIRDEVSQVLERSGGKWTKAAAAQMIRLDSLMRETMRLYPFAHRNTFRKVVAKDGVLTEDGTRIPNGTILSVSTRSAQLDSQWYKSPKEYDPFRFSKAREKAMTTPTGSNEDESGRSNPATASFSTPSYAYASFGGGRHACPGRWTADFEMKMLVAYLVTNYDLKLSPIHGGVRPVSPETVEVTLPPKGARILLRRRRAT